MEIGNLKIFLKEKINQEQIAKRGSYVECEIDWEEMGYYGVKNG